MGLPIHSLTPMENDFTIDDQNFCWDKDLKISLAVESFKSLINLFCKLWGDCKSVSNKNYLNRGNNFPTDHVTIVSGFAPTR